MQIQSINNNLSFRQKIKLDDRIITQATKEEKFELAILKRMFKEYGDDGIINLKYNKKVSVKDIIDNLKSKFKEIELKRKANKSKEN